MKLFPINGSISFTQEQAAYSFLPTGDIYQFQNGPILLNGFTGSKKEGSANNIWLRIYHVKPEQNAEAEALSFYPLLGIASSSQLSRSKNALRYSGSIQDISYEITFRYTKNAWFFDIVLKGNGETVDLVYGQDLGMAEAGALLENELYAAQYLGHTVLENENGCHVCSRQNLPQGGSFPYVQQGLLTGRACRFSTDGSQFFGASCKNDNIPAALLTQLENKNLQLESSYIALQTEQETLRGCVHYTFYGYFQADHAQAVTELYPPEAVRRLYLGLPPAGEFTMLPRVSIRPEFGSPYSSPEWSSGQLAALYPERKLEEWEGDTLLSFFTPEDSHVVAKQKELLVNRPHGNIIETMPDTREAPDSLITSTQYIYGLFNAQTVVGNTSKHKLLSASRGLFNLQKNTGQRVWLSINGTYRLLSLPSVFEMGFNYSRWLYQIEDDILQLTSYALSHRPEIILEAKSRNGKAYDFIITNQLVMGTHEFLQPLRLEKNDALLTLYPETDNSSPYPDLHYNISLPGKNYTFSDDRVFFIDREPQNTTLLTLSLTQEKDFRLIMSGHLTADEEAACSSVSFEQEKKLYHSYYKEFLCGLTLEIEGNEKPESIITKRELQKLNTISMWYAHNALIHFSAPHGLEQPGGAAWGTRDVCQGPMELFLATGKFTLARNVLLNLFSHQFPDTGEWPQWFMFDRYTAHQEDCHGDVVFWPLKCIADYITASGDSTILDETVPFVYDRSLAPLSLTGHIRFAVSSIEGRFLKGTHLISYAGGDWDDTLQPGDDSLKERLCSAWTQVLAFQVFSGLSAAMHSYEPDFSVHLKRLADAISADFEKYLVIDGIPAGFVYRAPDNGFCPMLHPSDKDTGIRLRLLPLTRSIISGVASPDLARSNLELIEEKLHFPDGVRLMDRPAGYNGGVSRLFKRAEQAANVGREISLQYVHAHIRYIEALCHMGRAKQAWQALFEINPVCIREQVKNAGYRQSNLYFSSSEGAFYDRYEYERDFEKLRDGSICVNGGWRLYSSGPGIYLTRLICDILGLRLEGDTLVIDPVLPPSLDGLRFHFYCCGKKLTFHYQIKENGGAPLKVMQGGEALPSLPLTGRYRPSGIRVKISDLIKGASEIQVCL